MPDNRESPQPPSGADAEVFRNVHLVGGPLNGQVKRFQIVSNERLGEVIGFKDKANPSILHFYKNRDAGLLSSRDSWADYSHSG